ncbi:MAG TPA: hypothetical protein VGA04_31975 [Streptosporangiaceae bacterium]
MAEPVGPVDDELEPVIDQEAAKLRTLELELVDDAEEWLAIVADVQGL